MSSKFTFSFNKTFHHRNQISDPEDNTRVRVSDWFSRRFNIRSYWKYHVNCYDLVVYTDCLFNDYDRDDELIYEYIYYEFF